MKKLFVCLLIITVSVQVNCQNLDRIIADFSKVENSEKVNIGKFGWNFVKLLSVGNKKFSIMRKISSVQVLDLSECSQNIKSQFVEQVDTLTDGTYELLLKVKEDEDEILMFSKSKKKNIRELIIIDKNDPTIVRLKGKFDLNDIVSAASFKL